MECIRNGEWVVYTRYALAMVSHRFNDFSSRELLLLFTSKHGVSLLLRNVCLCFTSSATPTQEFSLYAGQRVLIDICLRRRFVLVLMV
jgi:hypothetical protein